MPPKKKSSETTVKRARGSNKDPNMPKRPLNSYMLYSAEQRLALKTSEPDLKGPKLLKKIAAQWKALEDKSKYQKQSDELKKKYEEEMKSYNPPEEKKEEEKTEEKKAKRTRKTKKTEESEDDE